MNGYAIYDVLLYFVISWNLLAKVIYVPTVNKVLIIKGVFL